MERHNITLVETSKNDGYIDYDLFEGATHVGILQTIEDDRDFIFGRQIKVFAKYQGNGIGTSVIDDFIMAHDKPFRFCIATNSEKAISFWDFYLRDTMFNKKNLRSEIWEIWK